MSGDIFIIFCGKIRKIREVQFLAKFAPRSAHSVDSRYEFKSFCHLMRCKLGSSAGPVKIIYDRKKQLNCSHACLVVEVSCSMVVWWVDTPVDTTVGETVCVPSE